MNLKKIIIDKLVRLAQIVTLAGACPGMLRSRAGVQKTLVLWLLLALLTVLMTPTLALAVTTTASPAGGMYNSTQSVTLTADMPSVIFYTTDGSTPTTGSSRYGAPIIINSTTTLKFFAIDSNDNVESVKTATYTIDTTLPTGSIIINNGEDTAEQTKVQLTLACSDANGCSQVQFSNDNASWSAAESYATGKSWTLASGDGSKTVYVKFKDGAGNWSQVYSDTITLDTTMPIGNPIEFLPKTGQTKCYDAAGAEIACAGTGQDGEIQVAAAWQQFGFFNCKLHEIVGK